MALTPLEVEAIMLSLRVAGWAVLISLPLGIAVAWLLARYRFPGWAVVNGLVHLPLVLPPVVVGFVLLLLLGRQGPLGAWLDDWFGITLAFTWQGAAVAAAVVSFPLMVRAIRLSIEGMDRRLETAARTLGAPPALGVREHQPAADAARRADRRHPRPSPAASASSVRPSPSSPTSPARPGPCRSRSTRTPRCRAGWTAPSA